MSDAAALITLAKAFEQAEQQLLAPDDALRVAKAEVTRKGAIQLEIDTTTGARWYRWEGNRFRKLDPARDRKLPLAQRLNDRSWAKHKRILSYRPGKRLVLIDESGAKPRVIKAFKRNRIDRMVRNYELAHAAFTGRGIHAPEIIEYDRDHDAIVMVCIQGDRLQLSMESADLFHLAGEVLRDFQNHAALCDEPEFSVMHELDVIDHRAQRLGQAGVDPSGPWRRLRERLDAISSGLPPTESGLAHRDLHDKQFVQQGNYLALLDFDLLTRADTALDAANLLAHLVLRQLQDARGATQASIDLCGKKFLQGLDRMDDTGFWERLRFYQATTFARLALIYQARPGWIHLESPLVSMGGRCLDDLERIRLP
jgi:tRNA A-37 threonylcarbamoyl transferase component Bud32